MQKLYVSNLSSQATLSNVRQHFGAAGEVLEVEFAAERNRGSASSAFVTMATLSGAEEAVRRFHGRLFHDRSVMVSLVEDRDADSPRKANGKAKRPGVAVAQQYRERRGMVCELDCSGLRLTLCFFFQDGDSPGQRVEARVTAGSEFVAEGTAATKELAVVAVAEAWRGTPAPELDWVEVMTALKTVRAV